MLILALRRVSLTLRHIFTSLPPTPFASYRGCCLVSAQFYCKSSATAGKPLCANPITPTSAKPSFPEMREAFKAYCADAKNQKDTKACNGPKPTFGFPSASHAATANSTLGPWTVPCPVGDQQSAFDLSKCSVKLSAVLSPAGVIIPLRREDHQDQTRSLVSLLPIHALRQHLVDRAHEKSAPPSPSRLQSVICPSQMLAMPKTLHGAEVLSYQTRPEQGQCEKTQGIFANSVTCSQFCKAAGVGLLFDYAPGEVVFDWGFGCGHMLAWLQRLFGVRPAGHELSAAAARSAVRHTTNAETLCSGASGTNLSHIPDASIDHVVSNAAVCHLPPDMVCSLMLDHFLRMVKPGGTVWLGWYPPTGCHQQKAMPAIEWDRCLKDADVYFSTMREEELWGTTEYLHTWPPASKHYTLLVVKGRKEAPRRHSTAPAGAKPSYALGSRPSRR